MSVDTHKAVVRRLVGQVFNAGQLAVLDQILGPGYQDHNSAEVYDPAAQPVDAEGLRTVIAMLRATFPDLHMAIDHLVAEDDKVVTFWTSTGTHEGKILGVLPTGEAVTFSGVAIDRFSDGKIVESWGMWDILGVALQIGAIPKTIFD